MSPRWPADVTGRLFDVMDLVNLSIESESEKAARGLDSFPVWAPLESLRGSRTSPSGSSQPTDGCGRSWVCEDWAFSYLSGLRDCLDSLTCPTAQPCFHPSW